MNAFVFDQDVTVNARYHCDRHIVKMILEQTLLLTSTYYYTNELHLATYKPGTYRLPIAKWLRESLSNWRWLRDSTLALYVEYQYRYNGKLHKAGEIALRLVEPNLVDIGMTPFCQTMPLEYMRDNAIDAYRTYFVSAKKHLFQWTGRDEPSFIRDTQYDVGISRETAEYLIKNTNSIRLKESLNVYLK